MSVLPALLFVLFLALKLTGIIAWSWIWITAPLWGSLVGIVLFMIVIPLSFVLVAAVPVTIMAIVSYFKK